MKLNRSLTIAGGVLAVSALGLTGAAVASGPTVAETSSSSEGAADQAAQDAACKKAGVDITSNNIQYDDETGVCSDDGGGGAEHGPDDK